jgi:hypothetical protein
LTYKTPFRILGSRKCKFFSATSQLQTVIIIKKT